MAKNLVIFASGSGSNAVNVVKHFADNKQVVIRALFCNNPNAGVIAKMEKLGVPVVLFGKGEFKQAENFLNLIQPFHPDLIALLGFLWKVPLYLIKAYPNQIINLHPALLPKYGGKGMYGHFVHEAVKENQETETGISMHWVNEHYDEGEIIAQFKCRVNPSDSVEDIAAKIHELEQKYVPSVIEKLLLS